MKEFKKKMKEKIKQYSNKEYLDGYFKQEFITADGDADIYLYLNNKDELFDSRTRGNQLSLHKDIYEYIEDKTSMLDNDIEINLHIYCPKLTHEDQETVRHVFKEYYAIELYKMQREYYYYLQKAIIFIMIGIIAFLLYIIVTRNDHIVFLVNFLSFIFSFALWQGIDTLIYALTDIKKEVGNVTQNLLSEIDFLEED